MSTGKRDRDVVKTKTHPLSWLQVYYMHYYLKCQISHNCMNATDFFGLSEKASGSHRNKTLQETILHLLKSFMCSCSVAQITVEQI